MRTPADVAEDVVLALRSASVTVLSGHRFQRVYRDDKGRIKGMCSMFVRQCCEVAFGWREHEYSTSQEENPQLFGGSAKETEALLNGAGLRTTKPVRGDIVCFNRNSGRYGHIGIVLSNNRFAENTCSQSRGPGTVISSLGSMLSRITGYYHLAFADAAVLRVVLLPGSNVVACRPKIEEGVCRVDLRGIAEALGCEVIAEHIAEQGKIYIRKALDKLAGLC